MAGVARVVVVGAGLGGLAAAARLAADGHAVTVARAVASRVGGKLGWFARDGHVFDTGPSLVTLPQVYRDLFAATGGPLEDAVDLVRLDPAVAYRFADGTRLAVPGTRRGDPRARSTPPWVRAPARSGRRCMERAAAMWRISEQPFLRSPAAGRGDPGPAGPQPGRRRRPSRRGRPCAAWAAGYLRDPRLRDAARPLRHLLRLRPAPRAGRAGHRALRRAGVRFLVRPRRPAPAGRSPWPSGRPSAAPSSGPGCAVRRVLVEGGRAAGVELADGERLPADVVVSGADAAALYGRPAARRTRAPGGVRRDLARATPSLSGFVLLLALRGRTPGLAHHTVLFPADYDAEFDAVFGTGRFRGAPRPVADPTVYVSAPDDPALRPDDDSESWFVLVNAPRHDPAGGVDWDAPGLADRYADRVLDVMAERGLDVRDRVRWRVVRTPADLERDTGSVGGSIYGTSSNGARAAFLRPGNASPVPGLFLVGGSAHPGGGLPLVALSAEIVAGLIGPA